MNKKIKKVLVIIVMVFVLTGCTTVLKDKKTNKVVYYEDDSVKITLNENILCQPTDKGLIEKYNEYKKQIDISKLPKCENFKISWKIWPYHSCNCFCSINTKKIYIFYFLSN